jgi:hypothetical protein
MKKILTGMTIFLLFSAAALAQEQYGNIRGQVMDKQGNPLPGVTVTLESELYNPRSLITSESGIFRFLNVSVGRCLVKCELPGFKTYIQENLDVQVGLNLDLKIAMEPATLEEQVTVVAESPIVDMKKTGISASFTKEMLQEIPSARDPWVILQQAPGILVDRENVGGSESGQQSSVISSGSMGWNNMWNMDGVPITDMVALGASPGYYDFDTFEEIQIVTGGQDASIETGGVSINFITHRGTNNLQVMARTFFTNNDLQGDNRTQELKDLGYVGNQINRIMDYGIQVGGPIKKDKFWIWLGYGVQDIKLLTIEGYPDDTQLKGFNSKLNFQLSRKNRAEIVFQYNDKTKQGRGAGPTRPPETTFDQTGGTPYIKFEDEHVFSDNFLLSLKLAWWGGQFKLSPQGGMGTQVGYDYATGIYSGSFYDYRAERPSYVGMLNGNYFVEKFLGGDHEFRFGLEYRLTPGVDYVNWAGNAIKYYWQGEPIEAEVTREGLWDFKSDRLSFYINDAYSIGRLTFNLGLRLDREGATNLDSDVKASMVAPGVLPAVTYPGVDPGVTFWTFSPRFGFTYDLTGDGKTLIRGNIARYGSQEGPWVAYWSSASMDAGAGYSWVDLNGDDKVTTDELVGYPYEGLLWFWGFDPSNPTNFETLNVADKNLKVELSDEILLGLERELFTDFSLSANLTFRRNHRFMNYDLVGQPAYYDKETGTIITQENYVGPIKGTLNYNGKTYEYEYWSLNQYRPTGNYMFNLPDYHEDYKGLEITAVKRLSHRWMMNASFTYQIHTVHYGEKGFIDPTNVKMQDGGRWQWLNADWMAKLSLLYQLPWGFNISFFANARQGFVNAQEILVSTPERADVGLGSRMLLYIEKPGETRLPDFYNVDVSLTKDFRLSKYGKLTLSVDAFNVFNFAHTLSRYNVVNSTRHDEIQGILNPRVIRLGVRYNF